MVARQLELQGLLLMIPTFISSCVTYYSDTLETVSGATASEPVASSHTYCMCQDFIDEPWEPMSLPILNFKFSTKPCEF